MEKIEQSIGKQKREKGSVTLFVLIAMIFFLVIIFTWFASVKNKLIEQEKEIKIIQNEYNASDIDQKYSETVNNLDLDVHIILYKETGEVYSTSEWTNRNLRLQIFYSDEIAAEDRYYYIDDVKNQYTDGCIITENCTISVKYQDKTRRVKITRIDKVAPTVQMFPNGDEIKISTNTGTINVQVRATDNASGINKIKYAWSTSNTEEPSEENYQDVQNGETITKEDTLGTYYLWTKVTDIAGNETSTVSNSYTIREPLPPTVTMRHTNLLGELYTGGWTNEDIYTEITTPVSEGNVEKYEYSKDGINWKEIDGVIESTAINYTTTFPMTSEGKPEWLGDLTANGTYYFVEDGNGSIISNNKGKHNQVANSYIKIDLTDFTGDDLLNISVNAQVSSQSTYDCGYATITETTDAPAYDNSTGQFIKISGTGTNVTTAQDYSIGEPLEGGKIYYLHFGYRKNAGTNSGNDQFTINSITLSSETLKGGIINFYGYAKNGNTVTYKLQQQLDCNLYFRALYDDNSYSRNSSVYNIRVDKTAPIASVDSDFTGIDTAFITISNIIERTSGFRGYYISTNEEAPTKNSNWIETSEDEININNLLTDTTYYVWLIDNAGNISDTYTVQITTPNYVVDDTIYTKTLEQAIENSEDGSEIKLLNDYTDDSLATIDKNITFDIQNHTLTRTKVITVSSGKEVAITGEGTITSSTDNYTISNSGTLNINMQGKIENTAESTSYGAISNSGTLNVNSGNIEGYYRGLYNASTISVININEGTILSTYNNYSSYAIYNYRGTINLNGGTIEGYYGIYDHNSSNIINIYDGNITGTGAYGIFGYGTTTINGGHIKGKSYGSYQCFGTLTINDGYIEGDYGIYQNNNAVVYIYSGKIEGRTYGIYGKSNNKIAIGDEEIEVTDQTPIVSGGLYGIYMYRTTYSYKFNNGIIMGLNTIPHTETVVPRDGYIVYTYYDYNLKKYCSVLTTAVNEITIEETPTEWTNKDVEILVKYPILTGSTLQFSEDRENWIDVNNFYRTTISENKTVYARMLDTSGIILEQAEYEITNIDKILPTVSLTPETTKYVIYDHGISSVDISVAVAFSDEGGSGLNTSYYGWSTDKEQEPDEWIELVNGNTITKENCDIGTYYLWLNISDNAGNRTEIDKIRYIVELQEAVAKIGDDYYYTIQDAFDAAGTTPSTVEIIKDTDEIATLEEEQTVILDLKGHTVGSSTSSQAVITNNGTLTIIDTSNEKTGIIENLVGTGILNEGTLTIGDNSTNIEDNTPTISGKKKGIVNNNTLNYYDGTIIGKIAIEGEVQDTPESYGPVGTYENGMTKVNLRIISDYVARINWFYYTTLQSAIDACEAKQNNTEQTTVIMLKDIVLDRGSNVYYGQNVKLDLHGYTLTCLKTNETVIANYGVLNIDDLSENKTGTISSATNVINNYDMGIINLDGGIISSKSSQPVLTNESTGTINVNGGTISGKSGIANVSIGAVNINGGTIDCTQYYNCITNYSTGTVNVNGGTISGTSVGNYVYGIANKSTGTININGGTISFTVNHWSGNGIVNNSTGAININGGTISITVTNSNTYGIANKSTGTINVNGGSIYATDTNYNEISCGILNSSTGTINVNEGNIYATSSYSVSSSYGILNSSTGTINVNEGNIYATSSHADSYGINNSSTGIINVYGGTISATSPNYNSYSSFGINNHSTGTINVYGGNIFATSTFTSNSGSGNSYGINNNSGTINVNEGTISAKSTFKSNSYGIANSLTGIINVNGGMVYATSSSAPSYGITNSSTGVVNIGTKGNGIVSDSKPSIKANSTNGGYGISNNTGKVYFYDGLIQGSTKFGTGGITSVEDGYQIKEDTIDGYNSIYLEEQEEIYIVRNETINKEYTNLQEAVEEATNNEENSLKILRDFDLKTRIEIPENKIINIDLEGNIITNNYIQINNYGDLIIEDSVGNGNICCVCTKFINNSTGTINVNGGMVSATSTYGIYNNSTGTINVNGGMVSSATSTSGGSCGIINESTGTINVNGGMVSATSTATSSDGFSLYGIINESAGTINVNGGTVSASSTATSSMGIQNSSTGTINVNGGTISDSSIKKSSYGIYNHLPGIININGGNISATSTSSSSYGLYNSSNGILNIGTKGDGIVSNTEPSINAESTKSVGTGIYNKTGTLYFYDGRIEGSSLAVDQDSVITEIEDNTELLYEDDDKVLTLTTEAMDIAKIGNTTYSSLQDAIDAAGTNTTTIELLRGIQYTNQDTTLTIANNQDITLDLKGFPIISAIEDAVITNNGKLKITDSTQEAKGKISGSYENIIHNKPGAILELNNGTITRIISKDNIVYNEGTVNVTGGTISQPGYGYSGYVIYNIANATLNISAGTISGGADSIYNKGNVNITSGTIGRGITNTDSGSLRIENGTINGTIQNSGNASVEITGGNITTTGNYGIHNTSTNSVTVSGGTISSNTHGIYSTTGTVTIGTKDGNIVGTPAITGNTCGITAQGGVLNIYDGTINGKTSAISGEITELEEQSEIVVNRAEEYETITLVEKDTPLAQVGANEYYSLQDAIDSISGTGTVTILREGTVENTINNVAGKNVTLDLNGNILKMYTKIQNTGTLNITDTSGEITGNLISYKDSPIYNSGNLEFISGKISENSYGIYNQTNGTAVISGGNLNNNTYGIYAVAGTVNVTSGNITQNTYGTFNYGGTINIAGGNITNNSYGVYNSTGTTNITAGTINTNNYGVYNNTGITNISQITLTGNTKEVYNGGTGTINIISGNITTSGETAVENASSGIIVVGTQDGNVITDSPVIQSEEYGITNSGNGTIKFYDGTIKGKNGALFGLYLYLENGYKVKTDYTDDYYCDTLTPSGTVSTVASIGGIEYTNLQSAINACTQEEASTITLVNSINTNTTFVVEEGQNIIIDLNGKNIISSVAESTIDNAGTLTIIDTHDSQTGKISNSYAVAINNTGTLTLGQDDGTVSTTCPEVVGTTYGIVNNGIFNFYDGIIKAGRAIDGSITSRATGYVINKTTTDGIEKLVLAR